MLDIRERIGRTSSILRNNLRLEIENSIAFNAFSPLSPN